MDRHMTELAGLPCLTADLPGIGGRTRVIPEDFLVEERPLYLPCGSGEHLYLRITKRGLSTPDLVLRLSSRLGIKAQAIGVAGLKDARAVTTQLVSVQGVEPERVARLAPDDSIIRIEVLGFHRNRLRKGHHAGNLFRILVRDVEPPAADVVPEVLQVIRKRGVPNYFGPQRQGRRGLNYEVGAQLLGDPIRRAKLSRSKRLWYLHAYQAHFFNLVLARRIGTIDQVLYGDWAMKTDNGACFLVEAPTAEQPRADRFEISPTGPLFGSRAPWASGEPGELERKMVAQLDTTREALTQAAKECGMRGERRALRVPITDLAWSLERSDLRLIFSLPPGAYATNVLRELQKSRDLP
jgi:tRNA pseudouridine13 synthase